MREKLPRWNLSSIYPSFDAEKYQNDKNLLKLRINDFQKKLKSFESASQNKKTSNTKVLDEKSLLSLIHSFENAADLAENLSAYTEVIWTTDTRNKRALDEISDINAIKLPLGKCVVLFRALLARHKSIVKALVKKNTLIQPYSFFLEESIDKAKHQMPADMEDLAGDLSRSGADSWAHLHTALVSTTEALWDEASGERKTVIELRDMARDPDRTVRRRAYNAELAAWKSVATPMAASLNGVKGQAITLDARRGWESVFEKSAAQSRISEKTLFALISALEKSLPVFHRYLKIKAKLLGIEKCSFYDLFAPLPTEKISAGALGGNNQNENVEIKKWRWKEACDFIVDRFNEFDPAMAQFAEKVYRESWVDAEGRSGKIGGAYCADFPLAKESRLLMNFEGSFDSVMTLAHETGHAWHHELVKDLPRFQAVYPMTLAETASIFAETTVFEGALKKAGAREKITLIESSVKDACQVIVDILSRFYFEKALFERREKGELSPEELCGLMLDAQKKTYCPALNSKELHPYMWAVKDHYYNHALSFYNYPYAFGQLFSLALYARFKNEGGAFAGVYRDLLNASGRMSAGEAARRAGFNIEEDRFWDSGIAIITARVATLCQPIPRGVN
jgi:pepF/M3 family oligoendopeptidase